MAATPAPLIRATAAEAIAAVKASGAAKRTSGPLAWNPTRHLLSRFAFGPVKGTTTVVPDTWFDAQVALGKKKPGTSAMPALATLYPYLGMRPPQTRAALKAGGNEYGWDSMDQLSKATIALQTWSPAQLYETVVDFFSNKLNVANFSDGVWATRASYDRDVIRTYAFGKYRDMLLAAMKHPAMLAYLNNDVSTYDAPNENLGRELLELHTVGIEAGYTQTDVVNSARILTGRGIDYRVSDYAWSQGAHWLGKVKVLGFSHLNNSPAKGESVGDLYLKYLANHPMTAAKLARQLCVRFVSDTPSAELVQAVAAAYLANDTAIVPMLKTIMRSTEFWESRGQKTRRPQENLLATVRALGLTPVDQAGRLDDAVADLSWSLQTTGQRPLAWPAPNGYPDVAAAWRSSGNLLTMWRNQFGLAQNWMSDDFGDIPDGWFLGGLAPLTVGASLDAIATTLLGQPLSASDRLALLLYLGENELLPLTRSRMQWEAANVAALILHSAPHAYR
ncbi:DUF1800 domain-containing protein [Jatrophihabitans sp. YIM 134969]